MSKVKKQHYIPQFYLRFFRQPQSSLKRSKSDQIWVFDKMRQVSFLSHIKDVGAENQFYDTHKDILEVLDSFSVEEFAKNTGVQDQEELAQMLEDIRDPQRLEKFFGGLEAMDAPILKDLIKDIDKRERFDGQKYKGELIAIITMQFLRTRKFRDTIVAIKKMLIEKVLEQEMDGNSEYTVEISEWAKRQEHFDILSDYQFFKRLANCLYHHLWVIGVNQTDQPLYTSDNPIAMNFLEGSPSKNLTFCSKGIEVCYPLSPKYILIIWEKNHLLQKLDRTSVTFMDGMLHIMSPEEIKYYNASQVRSSYNQVYSSADKFELIREMCKQFPELKEGIKIG